MIDTLVSLLPKASISELRNLGIDGLKEASDPYALVTLHRPSNVDDSEMLLIIMETLQRVAEKLTVVFPVHPRTRQHLQDLQFSSLNSRLHLIDPVGYIEFLALQKNATVVITDSGGIQEETTFLGIPCLTIRLNTERPITVWEGTNKLVGINEIEHEIDQILKGNGKQGRIPELWDGEAAGRMVSVLTDKLIHSPSPGCPVRKHGEEWRQATAP
jgi:UDP-N-acetylglucosamine 2-epimerase (non-hydrolysing)